MRESPSECGRVGNYATCEGIEEGKCVGSIQPDLACNVLDIIIFMKSMQGVNYLLVTLVVQNTIRILLPHGNLAVHQVYGSVVTRTVLYMFRELCCLSRSLVVGN